MSATSLPFCASRWCAGTSQAVTSPAPPPSPRPSRLQVADLRRLLELYQRWQMRFYPHCDFDTFVTKLEKSGRSRAIKVRVGAGGGVWERGCGTGDRGGGGQWRVRLADDLVARYVPVLVLLATTGPPPALPQLRPAHTTNDCPFSPSPNNGRLPRPQSKMHSMRQNLLGLIFPDEEPAAATAGAPADLQPAAGANTNAAAATAFQASHASAMCGLHGACNSSRAASDGTRQHSACARPRGL